MTTDLIMRGNVRTTTTTTTLSTTTTTATTTTITTTTTTTTGQFRKFESRRVHTRIHSWGLFLVHKFTCGKRESVS